MIARFKLWGEAFDQQYIETPPDEVWLSTSKFPGAKLEYGQIRFTLAGWVESGGETYMAYQWDGRAPAKDWVDLNACTLEEWAVEVDKMVAEVLGHQAEEGPKPFVDPSMS